MSSRKKALIFSVVFHVLFVAIAFFMTFDFNEPQEFIEVEFAQALPAFKDTEPVEKVGVEEPIPPIEEQTKPVEEPKEKVVEPPKEQPKKVESVPPTKVEESIPETEPPKEQPKKETVTMPKRKLLIDSDTEKILAKKKDLSSPTEEFDDFFDMDKPDIKKAEIEKYETEKTDIPEEDTLPSLPTPTDQEVGKSDEEGTPAGDVKDDEGDKVTDISLDIEGTIRNRKIISRPEIDPSLVTESGTVKIKILVSPEGLVESMIPLSKAGNLEKLAMNNLRNWRFEKLPSDKPQENQSGMVTFRFILK